MNDLEDSHYRREALALSVSADLKDPRWIYHLLLLAVIGMFALQPLIAELESGRIVIVIFYTALLWGGVISMWRDKVWFAIGLASAVVGISIAWRDVSTEQGGTILGDIALAVALLLFILHLFRRVLSHRIVTGATVSASLLVYLLLGLLWTFIYAAIESASPGSFGGLHNDRLHHSVEFHYFSYVTMTTLGYGDVVPISYLARTMAALEALFGQVYLVVAVARLVGMQITNKEQSLIESRLRAFREESALKALERSEESGRGD